MPIWFALLCVTDQFTSDGKLDYPAGSVKSFGTVISGTPAELLTKGIEAIPIGNYGASGPDFNKERFDVALKMMVPFTPPKGEAEILLEKPTWTPAELEKAIRLLLQRGLG